MIWPVDVPCTSVAPSKMNGNPKLTLWSWVLSVLVDLNVVKPSPKASVECTIIPILVKMMLVHFDDRITVDPVLRQLYFFLDVVAHMINMKRWRAVQF